MKSAVIIKRQLQIDGDKEDHPVVRAYATGPLDAVLVLRDGVNDEIEFQFATAGEARAVAKATASIADWMEQADKNGE